MDIEPGSAYEDVIGDLSKTYKGLERKANQEL